WFHKMENLVLSLRRFGGALSESPMVVNVVGDADPDLREAMSRLGAEVRIVETVDARRPTSNKLRMFELADDHDFDVLVMMDCDMIVKGDFASEVRPGRLRMLPAGRDLLDDATWRKLFRLVDAPLPRPDCVTTVTGQATYPYYNSGVLFVPREACAALHEHWARHLDWILGPGLAQLGMDRLRKDQIPLAAALATAGLEVDPLPVNMNLSVTAARYARPYRHQWGPPFLIHYHRLIDHRGFLAGSPNARVNPHLDEFNLVRARHTGLSYSGLARVPVARRIRAQMKDRRGLQWVRSVRA
ncbi:MAG: hypothetical protein ACRD1K_11470, partial [Acidimicrobiales bacterium]